MDATLMDADERRALQQACSELVLRAAACVDGNDAAGLAQLFAEDAVLVRPNGAALHGREAIQAAYAQRPADRITRHLVTNTVVEVESPTRARALSYVLLWTGSTADAAGPNGRPAQSRQVVGEFDDRFSFTPDAGWLLQRREARFVLHSGD
jgi:uncharacterized protein (TIGR02246 family)